MWMALGKGSVPRKEMFRLLDIDGVCEYAI